MAFNLEEINIRAKSDPRAFIEECDAIFDKKIKNAAEKIAGHIGVSRIVLLSGPSGSGKTTTAKKIEEELRRQGINSYAISLDNYFRDVDPELSPKNENGEYDFESPLCLDIELLLEHFRLLDRGDGVMVPKFSFMTQKRDLGRAIPLRLRKNEIAIFEGIHALNDLLTANGGQKATKVYISARSNVESAGKTVFKGTWMRLTRRIIRDMKYRGASAAFTFGLWENVRNGEKLHISPFKNKADIIFDSAFPYEVCVLRDFAAPLIADLHQGLGRRPEILEMGKAYGQFVPIDESFVHPDSLIREFIGGGSYVY